MAATTSIETLSFPLRPRNSERSAKRYQPLYESAPVVDTKNAVKEKRHSTEEERRKIYDAIPFIEISPERLQDVQDYEMKFGLKISSAYTWFTCHTMDEWFDKGKGNATLYKALHLYCKKIGRDPANPLALDDMRRVTIDELNASRCFSIKNLLGLGIQVPGYGPLKHLPKVTKKELLKDLETLVHAQGGWFFNEHGDEAFIKAQIANGNALHEKAINRFYGLVVVFSENKMTEKQTVPPAPAHDEHIPVWWKNKQTQLHPEQVG